MHPVRLDNLTGKLLRPPLALQMQLTVRILQLMNARLTPLAPSPHCHEVNQ